MKNNDLCARVLKAKHGCGSSVIPKVSKKSYSSNVWKGVVRAWPHIEKGMAWNLGNGLDVNFWSDRWIPNLNALDKYIFRNLSDQELNMKVAELVSASGNWDWSKFALILPESICLRIANILPSSNMEARTPSDGIFRRMELSQLN